MIARHLGRRLAAAALLIATTAVAAAPATCVDGQAGGFECQRVDLVAHLDTAALGLGNLNDVWGWTDPDTGTEYALVGAVGGTAFVDLSDPENPVLVGRLPAHEELAPTVAQCAATKHAAPVPRPMHDDSQDQDCGMGSLWRNIKTYADHAYIGSEAAGHGLQVFDLTQLRDVVPADMPVEFEETAHYGLFGNSHTLIVNEATGYLYAVGSNTFNGGPHFVNLAAPASPQPAGGYAGDGYTHEALCVNYAGPDAAHVGREICFASNEDTLTIVDVTNKASPQRISRTGYSSVGYAHQGWLTADQRYFFMNDELDELDFNQHTTTLVWDLNDLQAPQLVRRYRHPTFAIDHNNYVRDGFVFQSNYTAGLVVLDGRDPLNLFEAAYFDTHPADDLRQFDGTWSNYPFFASGLVAVSDITGGLFVLRPQLPAAAGATDLGVQILSGSGAPAGQLRLLMQVTNLGAAPAPDVIATFGINASLSVASVVPLPGTVTATCIATPDPIVTGPAAPRCRAAALPAGQSFTVQVDVTFNGFLEARAWTASGVADPVPDNNVTLYLIDELIVLPGPDDGGGGPFDALLAASLAWFVARRRRA